MAAVPAGVGAVALATALCLLLLVLWTPAEAEADSAQAMAFFRDATANLADKKYAQALKNLDKAVSADPSFVQGFLSRAKLRQRSGDLDGALEDYNTILRLRPGEQQASDAVSSGKLTRMAQAIKSGQKAFEASDWTGVIAQLKDVAHEVSYSSHVQFILSKALYESGEFQDALLTAGALLRVSPNNLDGLLLRGQCLYETGEDDMSLQYYRRGLRLDPEHKVLKKLYKSLQKSFKTVKRAHEQMASAKYREAVDSFASAIELETRPFVLKTLYLELCRAQTKAKNFDAAIRSCSTAIEMDESVVEAWTARGEAHLLGEQFEEAVQDYSKASQMEPNDFDIRRSLQNAQAELKKSKRKNYYKILGVRTNADERDIKMAYRKLVKIYHPDRNVGKSDSEKEEARLKYLDIRESYDVLSDPDQRARFDRGEDLDDPHGGQQGGFHRSSHFAFQHGGFQFQWG